MASKGSTGLNLGLLILRLAAGGLMAFGHGWGKLIGWSERAGSFPDPLGIGSTLSLAGTVGAEFFCAILVMLGLATRIAAIPLIFTMLVAAFIVHGADPFMKKELGLLYAAIFLALLCTGGGTYSLGQKLPRLKKFS